MDWDLIALDEIIERNRTERLDDALDFLSREERYVGVSKKKKKKSLKKNKKVRKI